MSAAHDNTIPNNLRALVQSSKEYGPLIENVTELDLFQLAWNESKPHPTTFGTVETEIEALLATVAIKQGLAVTPLDLTPQKPADAVAVSAAEAVVVADAPIVAEEVQEVPVVVEDAPVAEVVLSETSKPASEEAVTETTEDSVVDQTDVVKKDEEITSNVNETSDADKQDDK